MKISPLLHLAVLGAFVTNALLIPGNLNALSLRSEEVIEKRDSSLNDLWKRKGGGGGGKGGSGGSSSSSSGGSSAGKNILQAALPDT
jgi:uncharacterized membrane protein YgcG